MTDIPIAIPPGIISDDTSFAADGRWEDANNVRFWREQPEVIGGWSLAFNGLGGVCRSVMPWTDNVGSRLIALGTHSHLYVHSSGELNDITPTGLEPGSIDSIPGLGFGAGSYGDQEYGTARNNAATRTWSLDTYGQSLMANPRGRTIYWWQNNTATPAAALTNAPEIVTCMLVTPERQVLAFGCDEELSGDFNPLCIRGSDIENPTVWQSLSTNNAFEHILSGGGRIVKALMFANRVAVWTNNAVYLGVFIGKLNQAYRFDRIAENHGLIGPNAVTIVGQTAYWIGPDFQFRVWTIGAPPQIIPCPIRNDFKDNLSEAQGDKIVAVPLGQFSEVWFHYPDARDGNECSRYVAVSTIDGSWFRGIMARSAGCDAGVNGYPLKVTPDGWAFYHELGQSANGSALEWRLKSSDQYLEQSRRFMMVRGIRPDFEDQSGAIELTVYARPYPQSDAIVKGPFVLTEGAGKSDFRVSGAIMAVQFSGASNPSFMRLGKPIVDAVPTGER